MYHFRVASFGATSGESASSVQSRGSSTPYHNNTSASIRSLAWNDRTSQHAKDLSLQRSSTMPLNHGENREFHRSASGGLIVLRRTLEERKKINEARASELSSLYELSDIKNTELNKKGIFKIKATEYKGTPSVLTITPKEAAKMFEKRAQEYQDKHKGAGPLLTAQEMRGKVKLEDMKTCQAAYSSKHKESEGCALNFNEHIRAPFSVKEQNVASPPISQSLPVGEENLYDQSRFRDHVCDHQNLVEQSIEVIPKIGGFNMNLSPQIQANHDTQFSQKRGDKISNDKLFYLPALC